ncbi:MAG: queuosine precursor transporter [Clostridiales bacterium]|nr:queuosine precursor transporter [Clostridiales bacterium]
MNKQVLENPAKNQNGLAIPQSNTKLEPLVIIACLMTACYLTSNIMAVKVLKLGGITLFDAGTITFPFAYMLGDVLTEIWGFKKAKKVIFLTFICNAFLVICTYLGTLLPFPDSNADIANAYSTVFNYAPRILVASFAAFLVGEISNAFFMDKIKEWTKGNHLWMRTIGSSAIGHALDTIVFTIIAFAGELPINELFTMIISLYIAKFFIEALAGTPLAYLVISKLKKKIK